MTGWYLLWTLAVALAALTYVQMTARPHDRPAPAQAVACVR
jgi:hypothetical protein